MSRALARISNSHLRRSPRAISMYAVTVPSRLVGGLSRHTCLGCAATASRLAASEVVARAGRTSGGRSPTWAAAAHGRTVTNSRCLTFTRMPPRHVEADLQVRLKPCAQQHRRQRGRRCAPDELRGATAPELLCDEAGDPT